jgi:para-aminobenzoate synthetase component 1
LQLALCHLCRTIADVIKIGSFPLPQNRKQHCGAIRLDSGHSASPWDRWSYDPGPAKLQLQCDSRTKLTTLRSAQGEVQRWDDPIAALQWLGGQNVEAPTEGPPFKGGWIGNLSYDLGRLFERLPEAASDDLQLPLFTFTYHDRVVAIDRAVGMAYDCRVEMPPGRDAIDEIPCYSVTDAALKSTFTRETYENAVSRAMEYIRAGDVFQVNLSQRFSCGLRTSPRALYDLLLQQYPAWFGALLDYGDHALLCNSPELFLRVTPSKTGRSVLTRPIKGTRPRGDGFAEQLRNSDKDQAELNMIIDLQRNDLGRVCRTGSVRVTEPRVIETHPTVLHGAATIAGELCDDVGLVELLRATFPGGSITGAPKIRAMEIIDELEPFRRGPYCGAIGYLSADGHMQFNIAIRTMIAVGDQVHISVGGGIVADSIPTAEYDETLLKAKAMFAVLGRS